MEGQKLGNRSRLPIHVSDIAVTSQDGSSLEFVTATEGRECNIQDARGRRPVHHKPHTPWISE